MLPIMNTQTRFSYLFGALLAGVLLLSVPQVSQAHGWRDGHHGQHRGHHQRRHRSSFEFGYSSGFGHRGYRGHRRYYGQSGLSITVPIYSEPAYRERVYVEQPRSTVVVRGAPAPQASALPAACEQTREFRTEIVIDGQRVPAYGTACLMPDGSWRQVGIHQQ
ncbi:MAG: hypothetical protein ACI8PT_004657 [Gammaproteobacteria bacterium]|jgi:hypothetical protein